MRAAVLERLRTPVKKVSCSPSVLLHLSILLLLPSPDICVIVACTKEQLCLTASAAALPEGCPKLHAWQGQSGRTHTQRRARVRMAKLTAEQHSSLTSIVMQLLLVHGNDVCAHAILHTKWHLRQQQQHVALTLQGAHCCASSYKDQSATHL